MMVSDYYMIYICYPTGSTLTLKFALFSFSPAILLFSADSLPLKKPLTCHFFLQIQLTIRSILSSLQQSNTLRSFLNSFNPLS